MNALLGSQLIQADHSLEAGFHVVEMIDHIRGDTSHSRARLTENGAHHARIKCGSGGGALIEDSFRPALDEVSIEVELRYLPSKFGIMQILCIVFFEVLCDLLHSLGYHENLENKRVISTDPFENLSTVHVVVKVDYERLQYIDGGDNGGGLTQHHQPIAPLREIHSLLVASLARSIGPAHLTDCEDGGCNGQHTGYQRGPLLQPFVNRVVGRKQHAENQYSNHNPNQQISIRRPEVLHRYAPQVHHQ